MNLKMFKKIIREANLNIKIDFSFSSVLTPNSLKLVNTEDYHLLYKIDKDSNKTLILRSTSENKLYKETLKYLKIKLDHFGKATKESSNRK